MRACSFWPEPVRLTFFRDHRGKNLSLNPLVLCFLEQELNLCSWILDMGIKLMLNSSLTVDVYRKGFDLQRTGRFFSPLSVRRAGGTKPATHPACDSRFGADSCRIDRRLWPGRLGLIPRFGLLKNSQISTIIVLRLL